MNEKMIRILVFPCGSEIGLEVYRSLRYSRHIELVGASSISDHGRFVYKEYYDQVPFIDSPEFEDFFKRLIQENRIDAVYPTMDLVISTLTGIRDRLGCKVLGSPHETNMLALSKKETYRFFQSKINVPKAYVNFNEIEHFPIFSKPDVGYGSKGTKVLRNLEEVKSRLAMYPEYLLLEYLPGEEYTVDCFTDKAGELLFVGSRKRGRVQKGISVNTFPATEIAEKALEIAKVLNSEVSFQGAWFFQLKENEQGELSLLEFATRLGGSSSLFRSKGINFALMTVFDAFDYPVEVIENHFGIELDRALDQKFKIDLEYHTVYVDLDDCLLIDDQLNSELIKFIFQSINKSKRIVLITKHERDLTETLLKFRVLSLFDELIHLRKDQEKSDFMTDRSAVFIDDSFAERKKVSLKLRIPVFAPDAVSALITE